MWLQVSRIAIKALAGRKARLCIQYTNNSYFPSLSSTCSNHVIVITKPHCAVTEIMKPDLPILSKQIHCVCLLKELNE